MCCGLAAGLASGASVADVAGAVPPHGAMLDGTTVGLVLASWDTLQYKTEGGKEECPNGFVASNLDNWKVQFPTKAAREADEQQRVAA